MGRQYRFDAGTQANTHTVRLPLRHRLLFRYRWQLVPVLAGAAAWFAAAGLRHHQAAVTVLALLGLVGLATWRMRPSRLRLEERVYGWAVLGGGLVFTLVAALVGPWHGWLWITWLILVVAGGIPWWSHRRVRTRIRLDKTLRAWPAWAERARLAGVRARSARTTQAGDVLRLETQRGSQTVQDVLGRLVFLAQVIGVPAGFLRGVPDPKDPAMLDLYITRKDPWRGKDGQAVALPHPAIADPNGWVEGEHTVRDPKRVGVADDGGPAQVRVWTPEGGRIIFVAGKKGAGKSTLVHDIIAAYAPCPDVDIVGVDIPKRGHTLGPWVTRLSALARTPAQGVAALRWVLGQLAERGEAGATGDPVHQPTAEPGQRAILLIVEELGATIEQVPEVADLLTSISRLCRSGSVALLLVDQRPDYTTIPGALRGQVDDVIVGRMGRRGDAKLILPGHDQVDVSEIPEDMPGVMMMQSGHGAPVQPIRGWLLEKRPDIATVLAACLRVVSTPEQVLVSPTTSRSTSPEVPMPEPTPTSTNHRADATRHRIAAAAADLEAAAPPHYHGISFTDLTTGHEDQEPLPTTGDDDLDRAIMATVEAAGPDGIAVKDLVEALRQPRATVQRRCGALRRAGRLVLDPVKGPAARWYLTRHRTPVSNTA